MHGSGSQLGLPLRGPQESETSLAITLLQMGKQVTRDKATCPGSNSQTDVADVAAVKKGYGRREKKLQANRIFPAPEKPPARSPWSTGSSTRGPDR